MEEIFQQGMITILFDTDLKGLRPALMNIQKEFREIIHTSFDAGIMGRHTHRHSDLNTRVKAGL